LIVHYSSEKDQISDKVESQKYNAMRKKLDTKDIGINYPIPLI
jgi:hypothetical protein